MQRVRIACFGEPRVLIDGVRLPLGGEQPVTLAVLAAAGPEGVTKEKLYAELFAENPQATREQSAVMRVHRLGKKINPEAKCEVIMTRGGRLAINQDVCAVDVWDFQTAVKSNSDGLPDVLAWWAEPFRGLRNIPPVVLLAAEHLRSIYRSALGRIGWSIDPADSNDLLERILREVKQDPFNEGLVASAAVGLYRSGRQPDALAMLNQYRFDLVESHGLDAGATINDVELAILNHEIALPGASRAVAPRLIPVPRYTAPHRFIGRTDLVEHLRVSLGHMLGSHAKGPQVHLLRGSGGSGKSAVISVVLAAMQEHGLFVRTGSTRTDGGLDNGAAYQPFVEAFPELGSWIEAHAIDVAAEEQLRLSFWAEVLETLRAHSSDQPFVLVLEDLHEADSPSVALLRHLLASELPASFALLISAREPIGSPWVEAEQALRDHPLAEVHDVGPLALDEIQEIIRLDHPAKTLVMQERFARSVLRTSRGNALVATTLSRDATEDLDLMLLPESVDAEDAYFLHVTRRVQDRELEQILWVASLVGLEFDSDRIAEIVDIESEVVESRLEQAARLSLCEHRGLGRWQFDHLLTAAALARAAGLMRPLLFAKLAHAGTENPRRMLRYVCGAGSELDHSFAVDRLTWAADLLEKQGAYEESAAAWLALGAILDAESVERLDALIGAAGALSRIGHRAEAQVSRSQAVRLARRVDDAAGVYRAALSGLPSAEYVGGDEDRLVTLLGMTTAERASVPPVEFTKWCLRLARAREQNATAWSIIESIDWTWPGTFEQWADLRAEVLMFKAQTHHPESTLAEMRELSELCPDGPQRAELLHRAAIACLSEQVTHREILEAVERASVHAQSFGASRTKWAAEVLAATLSAVGILPSEASAATARSSGHRWGVSDVEDSFQVQSFMDVWMSGQVGLAQGAIEAMREKIAMNVAWHAGLALSAAVNADESTARHEMATVVAAMRSEPGGVWMEVAAALLAETAFLLRDSETASAVEDVLGNWSGRALLLGIGSAHFGPVDRYLGLAAAVRDPAAAGVFLTAAVDQAERTGTVFWANQARSNLQSLEGAPR